MSASDRWKVGVKPWDRPADGSVRQGHLVGLYGPGAMVDFVKDAVVMGGLSYWAKGEPIHEPRLLAMLAHEPAYAKVTLHAPPRASDREDRDRRWVKAFQFPEWFVCQNEHCWTDYGREPRRDGGRPRRLLRASSLQGGKHACSGGGGKKKGSPVQPVRFVRACRYGHLDDLAWTRLVHGKDETCHMPTLWMDETGASGDLREVRVSCDCGKVIRMSNVAEVDFQDPPAGWCNGRRPWLPNQNEDCKNENGKAEPMRLLLRSASNAYFPQIATLIHVPDVGDKLRSAVDAVWSIVGKARKATSVALYRDEHTTVTEALDGFSDEDVFAEIERRRNDESAPTRKVKDVEVEAILHAPGELGEDLPHGRFYARRVTPKVARALGPMGKVDRVVLVHRLTEVRAFAGFTRLESKQTDIDGELDLKVGTARPDANLTWLPAVEHHGEGIFFSLKEPHLASWEKTVSKHLAHFEGGFARWKAERPERQDAPNDFVSARYILLHSLAHLLITSVSLECGYAASSIRERIYARENASGVLLYTASPGAEGSLGGLAQVGRSLERYLEMALDLGRLCANDPVCAGHLPDATDDHRRLEGASCHGCLLISESSCERMNLYLDRAFVVPTVEHGDAAFFREW